MTREDFIRHLNSVLHASTNSDSHALIYLATDPEIGAASISVMAEDLRARLGFDIEFTSPEPGHFLLLLRGTSVEGALSLTRMLRYTLRQSGSRQTSVKTAFGVVLFGAVEQTTKALVGVAEKAAMEARTCTRNRINFLNLME